MYPSIEITKEDLKKAIYFILMKYAGDPLHRQGTSSKRDFIGGFIDRWINRIPEYLIFDKLLQDRKYKIAVDNYLYTSVAEKNAPDIIGLYSQNQTVPFAHYNNGSWTRLNEKPSIEVKVFRKDQSMVTVRDTQMIDDYYVFVESDIAEDYLASIFEDDVFNERYFEELSMGNEFVKSDSENQIITPEPIVKPSRIGGGSPVNCNIIPKGEYITLT